MEKAYSNFYTISMDVYPFTCFCIRRDIISLWNFSKTDIINQKVFNLRHHSCGTDLKLVEIISNTTSRQTCPIFPTWKYWNQDCLVNPPEVIPYLTHTLYKFQPCEHCRVLLKLLPPSPTPRAADNFRNNFRNKTDVAFPRPGERLFIIAGQLIRKAFLLN